MSLPKYCFATLLFLVSMFSVFSANALNVHGRFTTLKPSASHHLKTSLLQQYALWKGTPYNFGGTRHSGIDCSALMQKIFARKVNLPRSARLQKKRGKKVGKHDLRIGDLVFFKSSPRVQHVGVYIGNRQFIHASQKVGVTISRLDNPYWAPRYETARRVLQ